MKGLLLISVSIVIVLSTYYIWLISRPVTYQPPLVESQSHPCLFFNSLGEVPGWRYRDSQPYKEWMEGIIRYAERTLLNWDPSGKDIEDPETWEFVKAQYAEWLALAYLLTNDTRYAEKCMEAFRNYGNGIWFPETYPEYGMWYTKAVLHYAVAYDLIANYVKDADPEFDKTIRDNIAGSADRIYKEFALSSNVHDQYTGEAALGCAALALSDYRSPYSTGPVNWLRASVKWLCEKHPVFGKPTFLQSCNPGGVHHSYSYQTYFLPELWIWFNAYQHYFNESLAEKYNIVRKFLNVVIWISLPNGVSPSLVTAGNVYWGYSYYMLNVLPEPDMRWHMWFIKSFLGVDGPKVAWSEPVWVASPRITGIPNGWMFWLFLLYDKYAVTPEPPEWTTFISFEAEAAVFRDKWAPNSDYLFLNMPNYPVSGWRTMAHHDSLSFEYYSKGDLLLCDSGEVKHWVPGYGPTYAKGHNTIMISNKAGGHMGGPVKGDFTHFYNPITLRNSLVRPYFEFVEAVMNWRYIESSPEGENYYTRELLDNPVKWHRIILYPNKEYFIVVDLLKGNQTRDIETLFHLSSLNVVPTRGSYGHVTFQGYVVGDLHIEGSSIPWVDQEYGEEYEYGQGNLVEWKTRNISRKPIRLIMFSAPKSEITVERFWCRIAGYHLPNEVTHPILRYKLRAPSMHRVTALLSLHPEDDAQFSELEAANGSAVKLLKDNFTDLVYAGNGSVSLEGFSTDAEVAYYRHVEESPKLLTLIRGSRAGWNGLDLFKLSSEVEYLSAMYTPSMIQFALNGSGMVTVRMYAPNAERIEMDGTQINFQQEDAYVSFTVQLDGVHEFKVQLGSSI